MALLKVEAEKLSNNMLERGVIEEIVDHEELFAVLPFMKVIGKAYVYDREATISEGDFKDPLDTVIEGAATFTEVVSKLRIIIGDVDVDKFLATTMNDTNDQVAIQIASKAKGIARKFARTLAIGDNAGSPKEFDGIKNLTVVGQTMSAAGGNGGALTLSLLDELMDKCKAGADVLVMRPGTMRAYKELLRTVGSGTDAAMLQLPAFGRPMLTHNGVPLLKNEFLPANETKGTAVGICSSVYALHLSESDGLHGLFGGENAGIVIEDVGTVADKDAWRIRVKWYCGVALKATIASARLEGCTNV